MNLQKINEAFEFATQKHAKQKRKGISVPYIVHPYEVFELLREEGVDDNTLIAGILHDTVEDTDTTLEELEEKFGRMVALIVDFCSEKDKSMPYEERKFEHGVRLVIAPKQAKLVKCADSLSNLRSIYHDINSLPDPWGKYNAGKEKIVVHYYHSVEVFRKELAETKTFKELEKYFKLVFSKQEIEEAKHRCEDYQEEHKFYKRLIIKACEADVDELNRLVCQNETKESQVKIQTKKRVISSEADSQAEQKNQVTLKTNKPYSYCKTINDCTECEYMDRKPDPDPNDWFCDDDQAFYCSKKKQVISRGNRPYESQPVPEWCPEIK